VSQTPSELVRAFIAAFERAWPECDGASLGEFFSEDAVFHNMPMEPAVGRQAIQDTLGAVMGMGGTVGVDMVNLIEDGPIVMTERVDYFTRGDRTASLPVMGIIEVHDGLITAWRDYFDIAQFTSQMPDVV
jgi:limonene-1,2-epoxide hydrolase